MSTLSSYTLLSFSQTGKNLSINIPRDSVEKLFALLFMQKELNK